MNITAEDLELVTEHAIREAPNECCGLLAVRDGVVTRVLPAENAAASPFRFEIAGPQLIRMIDEIEDAGEELGGIYHSHTRSEPYPSQTDINFAAGWPGIQWLIIGTQTSPPSARCFQIAGGDVTEVAVSIAS